MPCSDQFFDKMVLREGSYRRRRDSMGRYSRDGYSGHDDEITMELQEIMRSAPDERMRQKIQSVLDRM